MSLLEIFPCKLSNFEGPLDYLLYLVQQGEITLAEVPLHTLTQQFVERHDANNISPLEMGAEFVGAAAILMWLKSKLLLPRDAQAQIYEDPSFDLRLEALQQLVEYCSLKKAAHFLSLREEGQRPYHRRGLPSLEEETDIPVGLEITLDELAHLFQKALQRAKPTQGKVQAERWQVADSIRLLKKRLANGTYLLLKELFTSAMCRDELIVTFLAVLELMKGGEMTVHTDGTCQRAEL